MRSVSLLVAVLLIAPAGSRADGRDPYTPTKLEWLVLELEANSSIRDAVLHFSVHFLGKEPNTVLVEVEYDEQANAALMQKAIKESKRHALAMARARRWNWVKVEEMLVPPDAK